MVLVPRRTERPGKGPHPVRGRLELDANRWGGGAWANVDAREPKPVSVGWVDQVSFRREGQADSGPASRRNHGPVVSAAGVGQHWTSCVAYLSL